MDKSMPKKLSFTPGSGEKNFIAPTADLDGTSMSRKRGAGESFPPTDSGKKGKNIVREKDIVVKSKPFTKIAPKFVRTKFKPLKEMLLSFREERVALYVFQVEGEPGEALYKFGESTLTRKDMSCMADPNEISVEIIRLLVLQFTVTERKSGRHSFWMLPPSFVRDVRVGTKLDGVLDTYANDWMPPYLGLKYIYVPVQEVTSQWFLIVVSISDRVVYHLDSFLDEKLTYGRRITIEKVCKVLSQCITSDYYPTRFFKHLGNMHEWDIKEPDNNPYVPYGENSAVWVLEWMHMRDAFGIEIMATKINDKVVRMRTCMDLLCGEHNELSISLHKNSDAFWKKITT